MFTDPNCCAIQFQVCSALSAYGSYCTALDATETLLLVCADPRAHRTGATAARRLEPERRVPRRVLRTAQADARETRHEQPVLERVRPPSRSQSPQSPGPSPAIQCIHCQRTLIGLRSMAALMLCSQYSYITCLSAVFECCVRNVGS